jgi:D-2-hydroxyacid dehydrogenase (NADP+)
MTAPSPTASVLVVDDAAEWWRSSLAHRFPGITIAAAPSFAEADRRLTDAEVLITMGVGLTPQVVGRMPRLAWVQSLVSGHEHLRAALVARADVLLTTARGIHGPQMSETALLHMLMLARGGARIVHQQRAGVWAPWAPPTLAGRTVAVVGLGTVGRTLGPLCRALGMSVIGVSRSADAADGFDRLVPPERLAEVLPTADFVVLVAPARPDSAPLIGAPELRAMRRSAFLVNLGRGSLVDEPALVAALATGELAGAGLDVVAQEPLPASSPLWQLDQVLITPHLGGRSDRYAEAAMTVVGPNLERYLAGRRGALSNLV